MTDWERVEPRLGHDVVLEAPDVEALLVRFLSEILYLSDARAFVLAGVESLRIEEPDRGPRSGQEARRGDAGKRATDAPPWRLSARLVGDDRPERYEFHGDVKAVTYSELKIERCDCGGGPWMVQAVLDL